VKLGINIAQLKEEYIPHIIDLGVDSILLAFHISLPDKKLLQMLVDKGVEVHARYIPLRVERDFLDPDIVKEYGDIVSHWEFGGEPDIKKDEPGCRWEGTPEEYIKVLKEFAHLVPPAATLGTGSFYSGSSYGLRGADHTEFIHRLCRCRIDDVVDSLSLVMWTRYYGGIQQLYSAYYNFISILNLYHIDKPLAVTEFGTAENISGDCPYTCIDQADDFIKTYIIFRHLGYEAAYYFKLEYLKEGADQHWGLLDKNGNRTTAFYAVKTTHKYLKDMQFYRRSAPHFASEWWKNDYIFHYIFDAGDKWLHIIWHDLEEPIEYKDLIITRHPLFIEKKKGELI